MIFDLQIYQERWFYNPSDFRFQVPNRKDCRIVVWWAKAESISYRYKARTALSVVKSLMMPWWNYWWWSSFAWWKYLWLEIVRRRNFGSK